MPTNAGLYYFTYPSSETESDPLVLIHGAGGTHLHWPPEIRRLPTFKIYAPDLPGHGRSPGAGEQTISAYAEKVIAWLQAVDVPRAIFIGHSMGSAITLDLAAHHAPYVRALVLIGSGPRLRVNPLILNNAASTATVQLTIEAITRWSYHPNTDPRLIELGMKRMAETRQSVLYSDLLACDQFDGENLLERIQCPTLVISGHEDKMTPVRNSIYLAGKIPGARLAIIPEAGHMVALEQPVAVTGELTQFISGLP